jgi:hypothetical protein
MVPASIRFKNPGAMWGNALAIKWGAARKAVALADGLGQHNNIAVFPTYVQGICAQLDLWRSSPNYRNKSFASAIAIWCGHNSIESYIAFVTARVPGLTRGTIMNDAFWRGPMAIPFLKAQAWHEAGMKYPAPDADWVAAHKRVLSGKPLARTVKKAAGSAGSLLPTTIALHQFGLSFPVALGAGITIAIAIFLAWKFWPSLAAALPDTPHPAAAASAPLPADATAPVAPPHH